MLKAEKLERELMKAQSAMEYLMTYGWSILLIAIVLAAVFELGVFNSSPLSSSNSCLAQSGFLCTKPILNSTGILNITFGQGSGTTYTVTGVGCTNSTAAPSSFIPITQLKVYTGSSVRINFNCPLNSNAIGTPFVGTLWIRYNTTILNGQTSRIASANLKVSTSSPQGGTGSGAQSLYPSLLSVPITLVNLQSSSTGSNFQDMLSIDSDLYSSYINGNWMNVEFTTGNVAAGNVGTIMQAWIESNAINTATNTIVWVNLPGGIPAQSSTTIYMDMLAGNVMSASGPTGEAPQLSCKNPANTMVGCAAGQYAQYDNGASVFDFYDNFAGNTINPHWNNINVNIVYAVNNGLTFTSNSGSDVGFYNSYTAPNNNIVIDGYMENFGGEAATIGYANSAGGYLMVYGWNHGGDTQYTIAQPNGGSSYASSALYSYNTMYVISGTLSGTPTTYSNYNQEVQYTASFSFASNFPLTIQNEPGGYPGAAGVYIQWLRVRNAPPNSVMPSQTTGFGVPSQIIHYVPITLTNSQSSVVAAGTQIMVPFNANAYTSNEASNMQNVEFFYGNGTVIPSWLEGNVANEAQTSNLYTATNDIYWVLISPSIVASGGTQIIYAGFAPTSTNLFNGVTVGEAPQLSTTYAQYDNGAVVFPYYTAWGGLSSNSLPSGWTLSGPSTVEDNPSNTVISWSYYQSYIWMNSPESANTFPTVIEMYGDMANAQNTDNNYDAFGLSAAKSYETSLVNYVGYALCTGYTNSDGIDLCYDGNPSSGDQYSNFVYSGTGVAQIYSLLIASPTSITGEDNYGSAGSVTPTATSNTIYLILAGSYYSSTPYTVYWTRTRTYPPNGVLPSVSFGAFV